jgi:hypothetical protein
LYSSFGKAARLWADAWAIAADEGGWLIDMFDLDVSHEVYGLEMMCVYPPVSVVEDRLWRLKNQEPYVVTPTECGVDLEEPQFDLPEGVLAPLRNYPTMRECLLSLSPLPPATLHLVDALAACATRLLPAHDDNSPRTAAEARGNDTKSGEF